LQAPQSTQVSIGLTARLGRTGLYADIEGIYVKGKRSYDFGLDHPLDFTTAYFSLEFGLSDCVPIYSGGLGVLAGDHLIGVHHQYPIALSLGQGMVSCRRKIIDPLKIIDPRPNSLGDHFRLVRGARVHNNHFIGNRGQAV
jgi:hypothetical protein